MVYTPQISQESSVTLKRLSWALNIPMTGTINSLIKLFANNTDRKKVCWFCKDTSKCDVCGFNPLQKKGADSYSTKKATLILSLKGRKNMSEACTGTIPVTAADSGPQPTPFVIMAPKPEYHLGFDGSRCRILLLKEHTSARTVILNNADSVYDLVKDVLASADREMFLSVLLNADLSLIGVETVSIGELSSCSASPRDIFKSAILANAASVIFCHNHPSGSLTPSPEDTALHANLCKAGSLLGIDVHDHLIVSSQGYASLRQ